MVKEYGIYDLTPVEEGDNFWVKRDDKFERAGVRGSKARAIFSMLQNEEGCIVYGSRRTSHISRTARICNLLDIPCHVHTAEAKDITPEVQDCIDHGAEMHYHSPGYMTVLRARAREQHEEELPDLFLMPLGGACEEYIQVNQEQAENIPGECDRVVITVGTGTALSALLHGMDKHGTQKPVLGVVVGMNPEKYLNDLAPDDWEDRCKFQEADKDFREPIHGVEFAGIPMDSYFESKAVPYLESGDLFWNVAISPNHGDDDD